MRAPPSGTPIGDALGITPDVLYDLEINPNRPDAMSVAGVARDLAARLDLPFAIPEPQVEVVAGDAASRLSIEILDPDLCGRFHARVIDGVRVEPSPAWIAERLNALGMRPINNVVDASNYVMLELGQPNHTYDLAELPDGALRVRWARDGEAITTLDDVERTLTGGRDGVIADGDDRAVGIAGVMGGASTEISEDHLLGAARVRLVAADGHRRQLQVPRPALGGLGPLRAGYRSGGPRPGRTAPGRAAGPVGCPTGRRSGHRRR